MSFPARRIVTSIALGLCLGGESRPALAQSRRSTGIVDGVGATLNPRASAQQATSRAPVYGPLRQATIREGVRIATSSSAEAVRFKQSPAASAPERRTWIGRHPVVFGALVGFAGGYLIGYLPGDDAVFDDFTAGFNGIVMGGVGAGAGAVIGGIAGAARK